MFELSCASPESYKPIIMAGESVTREDLSRAVDRVVKYFDTPLRPARFHPAEEDHVLGKFVPEDVMLLRVRLNRLLFEGFSIYYHRFNQTDKGCVFDRNNRAGIEKPDVQVHVERLESKR